MCIKFSFSAFIWRIFFVETHFSSIEYNIIHNWAGQIGWLFSAINSAREGLTNRYSNLKKGCPWQKGSPKSGAQKFSEIT